MRTTKNSNAILKPGEIEGLLIDPVAAKSVAAQVAHTIVTEAPSLRFPVITKDPSAEWVAEGEEIPLSDGEIDEVEALPTKVAGLTIITNELADDSSPEAAQVIGDGLARDIARKIDAAFFGPVSDNPNAQKGIASLAGRMSEAPVKKLDNLDAFASARTLAEANHATIAAFVANPQDVLTLEQMKVATGSNAPLLTPGDATRPNVRRVGGTDLLVSPYVPAGIIYGVPEGGVFLTLRSSDAVIDIDKSVFFTSDRCAVRAKLRVAFAFTNPAAVTAIRVTG